jgi:hypothetical protein
MGFRSFTASVWIAAWIKTNVLLSRTIYLKVRACTYVSSSGACGFDGRGSDAVRRCSVAAAAPFRFRDAHCAGRKTPRQFRHVPPFYWIIRNEEEDVTPRMAALPHPLFSAISHAHLVWNGMVEVNVWCRWLLEEYNIDRDLVQIYNLGVNLKISGQP